MKIKKIFIQNFKGIEGPKVIDLGNDFTFLTGPNGFGKTTIFDILEICFTGELYRVTEHSEMSKSTNKNRNVGKPFYQNKKNKDVILKVLLELDNGEEKVIIAYDKYEYLEGEEKEKKNKPANLYFKRFIENYNIESFLNELKLFNNPISNSDIESNNNIELKSLLGLDNKKDLKEIYKIFNYLQQEENIYFLKKSEHDRHGNLDFIFGTNNERENKNKILKFKDKIGYLLDELNKKEDEINAEKKKIGKIKKKDEVKYVNFFGKNIISNTSFLDFDKEELFNKDLGEGNENKKNKYIEKLVILKTFLGDFDIKEYKKEIFINKLKEIRGNEIFLSNYILQKYNSEIEYKKLQDYNDIYAFSKKDNDIALKILLYRDFLSNSKFEEVSKKSYLYGFTKDNDFLDALDYYFLEKKINNEIKTGKLKEQNILLKYIQEEKGLLDYLLLGKLLSKKDEFKNKYELYTRLDNDSQNIILKGFVLRDFFIKKNNELSEYEKLEITYNKYNLFKNYKKSNNIDKEVDFVKIFHELDYDDNTLMKEFTFNLKVITQLKDNLDTNGKLLNELYGLKGTLLTFYESNFINDFEKKCILCGTEAIIEGNDKVKIESFEKFKEFVELKINSTTTKTKEDNKKIQIEKKKNDIIIDSILLKIDEYLKENRTDYLKFYEVKGFINRESYLENYTFINLIYKENEILYDNNGVFKNDEIDIDNINKNIFIIKEKLLSKYKNSYNLYNKITSTNYDESNDNDLYVNKLLDKKGEINDYIINEENFSIELLENTKDKITKLIKEEVSDFNLDEYRKINYFIETDFILKYKMIYSDINKLLIEDNIAEIFNLSETFSSNELEVKKENLANYIKTSTEKYHELYMEISNLSSEYSNINKNKLDKLDELLKGKNILEKIDNYSLGKSNELYKGIKDFRLSIFKNKVDILKELESIKSINSINTLNIYNDILKNIHIEKIENYDDYIKLSEYKIDAKDKILNEIELLENDINTIKLGGDNVNLLSEVFGDNIELLLKAQKNKNLLNTKQKYIEFKFFELKSNYLEVIDNKFKIIENRKKSINIINGRIESLIEIYDDTIKLYKESMVKVIELPFYIYTAKILQNFQQGMGIFIDMETETKGGNIRKKETINFYSSGKSGNDVIHQLSSGQLSVVSIAFTLAINNIYTISDDLKFINIDDPVQEMDSLNIHSFIELIRHNFMDYKFIISTHNDENAYFMKYKLEKFKDGSVKIINVQNEFFAKK